MKTEEIMEKLTRPLSPSEIELRMQNINKGGYATILVYKDARVDMNRLDEAFGIFGWQRRHEIINGHLFCHVSVKDPESGEWITKSDVGVPSQFEATKGEASDAFKRACFNLGIGRELYDYPQISIKLFEDEFTVKGDKVYPTFSFNIRNWTWFNQFTGNTLNYFGIKDSKGRLRFQFGEYIKDNNTGGKK